VVCGIDGKGVDLVGRLGKSQMRDWICTHVGVIVGK